MSDDATGLSKPFGAASIAKAVHATLEDAYAAIPEGRTHALIFDGTVATGGPSVRAMYVQKLDAGWNVVIEGDYAGPHGIAGKATVAKSW